MPLPKMIRKDLAMEVSRFVFWVIATALVLSLFTGVFSAQEARECFTGTRKQILWFRGEWHHIVDFGVDNRVLGIKWYIASAPLPSSLLRGYYETYYRRLGYRWFGKWQDPFPATYWKICYIDN